MQDASVSLPGAAAIGDASVEVRDGVKALVSRGTQVLLVKEAHSDGTPFWTLPGGGLDADETETEGLHRELEEELGARASVHEPVTTIFYKHLSRTNTVSRYRVFACSLETDPEPSPEEGIFDVQWTPPSAVPPSTLPQVRHALRSIDPS